MNILHLIDTLGIGGAEQMLVNLLPEFRRQGHTVAVAVLREPFSLQDALEREGVQVIHVSMANHWNVFDGVKRISHLARELKSDIIHAHLLFPAVYVGLTRMLSLTRARTCVTYHNLAYAPGCNRPGLGLTVRRTMNAITSRYGMDARFAVSQAVSDHYRDNLGVRDITVVPNPIPVSSIDRMSRSISRPKGEHSARLRVLIPGRLVHEKGHEAAIQALSRVAQTNNTFDLVIAGEGPLRATLERQVAAAGLASMTRFSGRLEHLELIREMALADIVVVPSLYEGFGMAAAEAMVLARCVVASRTGGLIDVVQDNVSGILFRPGDVPELTQAIVKVAGDPGLRARLGQGGRSFVKDHFDSQKIAEQMNASYDRVLQASV